MLFMMYGLLNNSHILEIKRTHIYIYKPSLDKSFTAFLYWKTKTEKERRFTRNVGLCCSSVWKTICTGSEGIKEYFIHVHTISDILGTVWSTGMTLLFFIKYQIWNIWKYNEYWEMKYTYRILIHILGF